MPGKTARMGIWLALVSVLSVISFPIGPVPVTLQVFAFFLMAAFLEPDEAFGVAVGYLVLGAIGIPIFAGGTGGFGVFASPTGGYLWGFAPAAWLASIAWKKNGLRKISLLSVSLLLIYLPGAIVLSFYVHGIANAVKLGVLPFIWVDAVKVALVFPLAKKIYRIQTQG